MIAGLGAAAFLVSLVGALSTPPTVDEAWMLVVARRTARGERPYRDFFYGAGPLPLWLLASAFALLRPQGVVMRGLGAVYVGIEAALVAAMVETAGGPPSAAVAAVATLVAFGSTHLHPHNHYGHLTQVASLAAVWALLQAESLLTGVFAGLAILGKFPQGAVVLLLVTGATVVLDTVTAGVWVLAGAAMVGAATALALGGDIPWFFRRAVANKGTYLRLGRMTPLTWLRQSDWTSWRAATRWFLVSVAGLLTVVTPFIAAAAFGSGNQRLAAAATVLAVTGLASVIPRFDGPHAVGAVPTVTGALTLSGLAFALPRSAWLAIALIGGVLLAAGLVARIRATFAAPYRRDVPSLRGLPVTPLWDGAWPDDTSRIPLSAFVLRPDAPMVYASGGISNPTPYDYPLASPFGRDGQAEILAAFESGLEVCISWPDPPGVLAPQELLRHLSGLSGIETPLGRLVSVDSKQLGGGTN